MLACFLPTCAHPLNPFSISHPVAHGPGSAEPRSPKVLKLLKALQFEIAAAWASMWRGMLQVPGLARVGTHWSGLGWSEQHSVWIDKGHLFGLVEGTPPASPTRRSPVQELTDKDKVREFVQSCLVPGPEQ